MRFYAIPVWTEKQTKANCVGIGDNWIFNNVIGRSPSFISGDSHFVLNRFTLCSEFCVMRVTSAGHKRSPTRVDQKYIERLTETRKWNRAAKKSYLFRDCSIRCQCNANQSQNSDNRSDHFYYSSNKITGIKTKCTITKSSDKLNIWR